MDPSAKVRTRPNYGLQYDPLTSRRGPRPDKSEVTGKVTEVLDAWGGEKPVTIGETLAAGTSSKTFSAWKETYSNRKGPTVWNPYIADTTSSTYGYFWGKDGGFEATERMKDTGKGFDAWYSGGLHITSPDTDLHTQTVEAHLPHEIPDPVTRKHLFGKDHWFMGAKYPNQDTISPETRAMYFTKGQQK